MNLANQTARSAWQDRLLTQLELAMDGSLLPCLPPDLTTRTAQRRAIRTAAERLTFCFAGANPGANAATLSACRNRLYAALTFLQYECNGEDRINDSLVRLMTLDCDLLASMLETPRHTPRRLLRHYQWALDNPRPLLGNIEAMVCLRLAQEDTLPTEELCTRAVASALAVLRGTAQSRWM